MAMGVGALKSFLVACGEAAVAREAVERHVARVGPLHHHRRPPELRACCVLDPPEMQEPLPSAGASRARRRSTSDGPAPRSLLFLRRYDFAPVHPAAKGMGTSVDIFMFGCKL